MWTNQRFPNKNNLLIVDDKDCVFNKKLGNYNNAVYTLKTKAKITVRHQMFSKCLFKQKAMWSVKVSMPANPTSKSYDTSLPSIVYFSLLTAPLLFINANQRTKNWCGKRGH